MYEVLSKDNANVIVSINSEFYVDYIMSGYEIIYSGTKKECNLFIEQKED
jgi:hypothetical protein